MKEETIKEYLDYDGYKKYQKGSKKFKEAVVLGLNLQLIQMEYLLKKMDKKLNK